MIPVPAEAARSIRNAAERSKLKRRKELLPDVHDVQSAAYSIR